MPLIRVSLLVVVGWLAVASAAHATTFYVSSNADSGPGTLRQAILDADASTTSPDYVELSEIPGATIALTSGPLPAITRSGLTIEGYQAVLDGSALGNRADAVGLDFAATGDLLETFKVQGFAKTGVVSEDGGLHLNDDIIGAAGGGLPNGDGVEFQGPGNTTSGGPSPPDIISGNSGVGIVLEGSSSTSDSIMGTTISDNTEGGLLVKDGAHDNRIGGGFQGGFWNTFTANGQFGIRILDAESNDVSGNVIGVSANGEPGPNSIGVDIGPGANGNVLGGIGGATNLIDYSTGPGIRIAANDTQIDAGEIGVSAQSARLTDTTPAPNGGDGILQTSGAGTQIGESPPPSSSGAPEPTDVSSNGGDGIHITGGDATVVGAIASDNTANGIEVAPGAHVSSVQSTTLQDNGGFGAILQSPTTVTQPTISGNRLGKLEITPPAAFTATQSLSHDGSSLTVTVTGATPNARLSVEAGADPGCVGSFVPFSGDTASGMSDASGRATVSLSLSPPITNGLETIVTDPVQGSKLLDGCVMPGPVTGTPPGTSPASGTYDLQVATRPAPATVVLRNRRRTANVDWSVTVMNAVAAAAASPATQLTVSGVGGAGSNGSGCSEQGADYVCSVPSLGPHDSAVFHFKATVEWGKQGAAESGLTASVPCGAGESDCSTSSSTGRVTVAYPPKVRFLKHGFNLNPFSAASLNGFASPALAYKGRAGAHADTALASSLDAVSKVQIAILAKGSGRACRWLDRRGRLITVRSRDRRCDRPIWLTADGTSRWSYRVRPGLPPGRYLAFVRAVSRAGAVASWFAGMTDDRIPITVR